MYNYKVSHNVMISHKYPYPLLIPLASIGHWAFPVRRSDTAFYAPTHSSHVTAPITPRSSSLTYFSAIQTYPSYACSDFISCRFPPTRCWFPVCSVDSSPQWISASWWGLLSVWSGPWTLGFPCLGTQATDSGCSVRLFYIIIIL